MQQVTNHDHDYFTWQDIIILQRNEVFKIGTDALLLGTWVPRVVADANLILDAGTGCGILALMMARHFPNAMIHAIEVDENALLLADRNFRQSLWNDRLVVRNENVLHPESQTHFKFDLIISNPPFYTSQNPPKEGYKGRSMHSDGPVGRWMTGLLDRIHPAGELCLIVPAACSMEWIRDANQMGYYVRNRMEVFSFGSDESPIRSLLHFSTILTKPVFTHLNIYQENRNYTPEYLQMTGVSVTQDNNP